MNICVYCGSSPGDDPRYLEVAADVGRELARRGIGLVYGGAVIGTMGAVANGALGEGGTVYGVIPEHLMSVEVGHRGLTELFEVPDMHGRKAKMAELADGFLVLPGGIGTLEELFEVWTWAQLGLHDKPIGIVDVGGYYQHLLALADHMVSQGFLRQEYRDMIFVDQDPTVLLDRFTDYVPPRRKFS